MRNKEKKKRVNISVNRRIVHYKNIIILQYEVDTFSLSETIPITSKEEEIKAKELVTLNQILSLPELTTEQKVQLSKYIHSQYEQK